MERFEQRVPTAHCVTRGAILCQPETKDRLGCTMRPNRRLKVTARCANFRVNRSQRDADQKQLNDQLFPLNLRSFVALERNRSGHRLLLAVAQAAT